jgi:deoxyribose-phosphate aldolase
MNTDSLKSRLTHTILDPEALNPDVHRVATEAMQLGIGGLMLAPIWIRRVAAMLQGSGVRICSTVAFPHGTSKPTVKAIEATSTIKDGADEIAVVPHLVAFIRQDFDAARVELLEIVRAARSTRRDVGIKVVVESALLMQLPKDQQEPAMMTACRAIRESGCDGVLTSTLFHPAGNATSEAIVLLKKYSHDLFLEAATDVSDRAVAQSLFDAGADRLTSPHAAALARI